MTKCPTVAGFDPYRESDGFTWHEELATTAVGFFPEFCRHVKGKAAGKPLTLNPWERDFVQCLIGWQREDATRRFREAFVGIPRKNSKTTFAAALSLLLLLCDGEMGAEIYFAALDRAQARLCFNVAAQMVKQSRELSEVCQVKESYSRIVYNDSFMAAIAADAAGSHGFNAHAVIMDETHNQPNRDLYDVLRTSMASRAQPLLVNITTAGTNKNSLCYELWEHSRKVRNGEISDPYFLPCLYEAPADLPWDSEETWKACNPNLGRSVSVDYLREAAEKARKQPDFENTFRNLHLDQWTESTSRWITSEAWNACAGRLPSLQGRQCVVGMDLASTDDITALVFLFKVEGGRIVVLPRFFVPEDTIKNRPRKYQTAYQSWQKHMIVTPGSRTRYDWVREELYRAAKTYVVREVAFDQWQALDTFGQLEERGFNCVKIAQTTQGLNPGVKAVEEAVSDGVLLHDANPVMDWMLSCTVIERDHAGNRKPNRKKSCGDNFDKGKIDGIVALVMAAGRLELIRQSGYENRGIVTL